jgi:hypothetical protein
MKLSNFKKISNIFSNLRSKEFKTISEKAYFDWKMTIILFTLLAVFFIGINVFIFVKVSKGEIFNVAPASSSQINSVDIQNLNAAIEAINSKKEHFELNESKLKSVPDPSL